MDSSSPLINFSRVDIQLAKVVWFKILMVQGQELWSPCFFIILGKIKTSPKQGNGSDKDCKFWWTDWRTDGRILLYNEQKSTLKIRGTFSTNLPNNFWEKNACSPMEKGWIEFFDNISTTWEQFCHFAT